MHVVGIEGEKVEIFNRLNMYTEWSWPCLQGDAMAMLFFFFTLNGMKSIASLEMEIAMKIDYLNNC